MDDIISRLSEIEDSSQAYVDDAVQKKKEIAAEINARKELWKQDLDAKTKAIRNLQDMYDTHHDKYVDMLFSNMIKE